MAPEGHNLTRTPKVTRDDSDPLPATLAPPRDSTHNRAVFDRQ